MADDRRLSDYSVEVGPKSLINGLLFGDEWVATYGFFDKPSKREYLLYLHLYGSFGLTATNVIALVLVRAAPTVCFMIRSDALCEPKNNPSPPAGQFSMRGACQASALSLEAKNAFRAEIAALVALDDSAFANTGPFVRDLIVAPVAARETLQV